MRKLILSLMAFAFAIAFIACPYQSSVPFDRPSLGIDARLLGKWYTTNYPQKNSGFHVLSKKSAREYKVVENNWNSSKKTFTQKIYRAWLSKLGRNLFLTVHTNDNKYVFYKLTSVSGTTAMVDELTNNIDEKFAQPAQLRAFILKNMHLSFFYNKTKTYYKK